MFHPSQSCMWVLHITMIFDKIKKYANVYVLHGTKTNGNLDCSYYETYTHKNFTGILHACKMVELYTILNTLA